MLPNSRLLVLPVSDHRHKIALPVSVLAYNNQLVHVKNQIVDPLGGQKIQHTVVSGDCIRQLHTITFAAAVREKFHTFRSQQAGEIIYVVVLCVKPPLFGLIIVFDI